MTPHEEFIKEHEATIVSIISRWVPQSSQHFTQKYMEAIRWFGNFKPSECSLALMLLEKIQYISDQDIRRYIETSADQIKKMLNYDLSNVLFYPLGDSSASSGSQFLYEYAKEFGLKDENFKSDDFSLHLNRNIDIVFFDDIIGSGNQATKFFNKNLTNSKATLHYIALLGFEDGIKKIRRDAGFQNVLTCKRLSDEEMAFSNNSWVFRDPDERRKIELFCQEHGRAIYPDHPLGYDNSQAMIVLPYNTPNNTLPVIWAGPRSESNAEETWHPLWARKKRLKQKKKQKFLDGAILINQDFLSELENKEFSPYQFYTSKLDNDCQWYGITQGWDGRRGILNDLVNQTTESFDSNTEMRVSAIVSGSGGSGKSTFLRRVAVTLAPSELSIIWVDNVDEFFQYSLSGLREMPGKCLVIIEDWYRFKDNYMHLNDLFKELATMESVRLLIGDRTTRNKLYVDHLFNPDNNLYTLDSKENDRLVSEIVEKVPAWKATFELFRQASDYRSITLFLLLFILARRAESGEPFKLIDNNLMSQFRAIVQSDIKQIERIAPGVASAITWWGGLYKNFKLQLGVQDFYLLADYFGKTSEYSEYLSFDVNSEINELLYGYINVTTSDFKSLGNIQLLSFNHDTLAEEGISHVVIEAGEVNTHLQNAKVLDYAVENLSDRAASGLLSFRLTERNFFRDKQKKIDLIEKLNDRGCTYHSYLRYLIYGYDLSVTERRINAIALLKKNEASPLGYQIVCNCLTILQEHDHEEAKQAAIALMKKNKASPLAFEIVCNCLTILQKHGHEEATQAAIALMKKNETSPLNHQIVCRCLAILQEHGHEAATQAAIALLKKNETAPLAFEIVCNCLTILQEHDHEKAKQAAIALLKKNETSPLNYQTVCNCLTILEEYGHEEARQAAIALLKKNETSPVAFAIVCNCLTILQEHGHEEARQAAIALLKENESASLAFDIVCNCLTILQEHDHEEAKQAAIALLKKNEATPISNAIVCNCLTILQEHGHEEARQAAIALLKKNETASLAFDIVCNCLTILQEHDNEEAKQAAIALLKKNETSPIASQIVCNCLTILQEHGHGEARQAAIELLKKNKASPLAFGIVCNCLTILQEHVHDEARQAAIALLKKNETSPQAYQIVCNCLTILQEQGHEEAKQTAIGLLKKNETSPVNHQIVCKCLTILQEHGHEEAKQAAIGLLKRNETSPVNHQIVCKCLAILREHGQIEAKQAAIALLSKTKWKDVDWNVVYRCLEIFARLEINSPIITDIISEFNCSPNAKGAFNRYVDILQLPFLMNESWQKAVKENRSNWKYKSRKLITNILKAFENHPDKTLVICDEILKCWRREIDFQLKKYKKIYFWQHIDLSINHPLLGSIALSKAKEIIAYDAKNANVLPPPLVESCQARLES